MQLSLGLEALLPGLRVRVLKPSRHTWAFSSSFLSHSESTLPSLCQGQGQVVYKLSKTQCLSGGSFPASRAYRQMWLIDGNDMLHGHLQARVLALGSVQWPQSHPSPLSFRYSCVLRTVSCLPVSASARHKSQPLAGTLQHYY